MVEKVTVWLADIPMFVQDNTSCHSIGVLCGKSTKNTPEFIAGRRLLANCVGYDALRTLRYTPQGKPYFPDLSLPRFSLSHSQNKLVLAFTQHHEIGIDIEVIREMKRTTSIIEHYFNNNEQQTLLELKSDKLKLALFWQYWTMHESILKQCSKTVWDMCPDDTFQHRLTEQGLAVSVWHNVDSVISLCCDKAMIVHDPEYIVIS